MSDDFDADEFLTDDEGNEQEDSPLLKKLRAELKKQAKERRAAEAKLLAIETESTQKTLNSVWDELNVPEKVRKFYPGESTAEAVKAWVADNAEVFNLSAPADDTATGEVPDGQKQLEALKGLGRDQAPSAGHDAFKSKGEELLRTTPNSGVHNDQKLKEYLKELKSLKG
jgi:hypothetical protein